MLMLVPCRGAMDEPTMDELLQLWKLERTNHWSFRAWLVFGWKHGTGSTELVLVDLDENNSMDHEVGCVFWADQLQGGRLSTLFWF